MTTRAPDSSEAALQRCIELLGMERVCDICGVSRSAVNKWANPNEARAISFDHAMLLDSACGKASDERPFTSLANMRTDTEMASAASDVGVAQHTVVAACGRFSEAYLSVTAPDSPGGVLITEKERIILRGPAQAVWLAGTRLVAGCEV